MSSLSDIQPLAAELRTVLTRLIKKLRNHSPTRDKLSLTERSVIKQLDQQPRLPSELAALEKVTTQSMSQIVSHLHELGYITRQPSAIDKRKVFITLSAQGQGVLLALRKEADEWLQNALQATCSDAELAALHQALPALAKLVDFD